MYSNTFFTHLVVFSTWKENIMNCRDIKLGQAGCGYTRKTQKAPVQKKIRDEATQASDHVVSVELVTLLILIINKRQHAPLY